MNMAQERADMERMASIEGVNLDAIEASTSCKWKQFIALCGIQGIFEKIMFAALTSTIACILRFRSKHWFLAGTCKGRSMFEQIDFHKFDMYSLKVDSSKGMRENLKVIWLYSSEAFLPK